LELPNIELIIIAGINGWRTVNLWLLCLDVWQSSTLSYLRISGGAWLNRQLHCLYLVLSLELTSIYVGILGASLSLRTLLWKKPRVLG